eukprot:1156820-Pelagomonas_calceolata.AAC.2
MPKYLKDSLWANGTPPTENTGKLELDKLKCTTSDLAKGSGHAGKGDKWLKRAISLLHHHSLHEDQVAGQIRASIEQTEFSLFRFHSCHIAPGVSGQWAICGAERRGVAKQY